jgi:ADP-heptose:LPS heptosyltransferase
MKNNILVIKHGAFGDVVLAGAAMEAIKNYHKNDYIICLTTKPFKIILKESPWFDMVVLDTKPKWYNIKGWKSLKSFFGKYKFKKVYDLQTSYRSNLYFFIFFYFKNIEWCGIAYGSSQRHNNPKRKLMHTIDRQKDQLKVAKIEYKHLPNWRWLGNNYENKSLIPNNKFIILVTGAAKHRLNKKWAQSSYASLIERFSKIGMQSILIGGEDEFDNIVNIISLVDKKTKKIPLNYAGMTSYKDIVYLSAYAQYAIGNDTGPIHLIATTGLSTIVLFGAASNPDLCAPKGKNTIILSKEHIGDISVDLVFNIINNV